MKRAFAALIGIGLGGMAQGDPAPPVLSSRIGGLELGVFCTPVNMGQAPAPGTEMGTVHVPFDEIRFDWPDRQVVPAELGIAFGIRAELAPGNAAPFAEIRVYRPGRAEPEIWGSGFNDLGSTLSFFSFDREAELVPGIWRFEAWDGTERLYLVEFEVLPANELPEIAGACGAVAKLGATFSVAVKA